ncbi:MAG: carboxypeptidase regulatory-like domain-containing protein [Candidatus Hodarchaeota archaeon]
MGRKIFLNFSILFFFFLILFILLSPSLAQITQAGALFGRASDQDERPLAGITIAIKSNVIILREMSTKTNEQGIYRFPSLPPGLYDIRFIAPGLKEVHFKEVKVDVGKTTVIDAILFPESIEEEVIVEGMAPTVDPKSNKQAFNLNLESLTNLPSPRTLDDYFNMAPGIIAESTEFGPMSSAHGSAISENTFNLDGMNLNGPTQGTQLIEFGTDIMDEISIQSGGLPAEYGDTTGAFVNVVTKSGGNKLSGSLSFYYSHYKWQSTNTNGTVLEGFESGYKYSLEPGITVGGPIIRDRLWFFGNLSFDKREKIVPGYPSGQPNEISADEFRPYPFLKLTYQPNQKHRLSLSYNFSDFRQNHLFADKFHTENATMKYDQPTHLLAFLWNWFYSDDFYASLKLGYYFGEKNYKAKTQLPALIDIATGMMSQNYSTDDLYNHRRFQLNLDGTYFEDDFIGSHELKLGAEISSLHNFGDHTFYYDPGNQMTINFTYLGVPIMGAHYEPVHWKFLSTNLFFYAQDTWMLTKRIVLNLGLRFGYQIARIPAQNEAEGPQTFLGTTFNRSVEEPFSPFARTTLSPRLGLIYDITGDGRTLFKASFSEYIHANNINEFYIANPNTGFWYFQALSPDYEPISGAYFNVNFPVAAKVGYGDYKLKAPRTDEVIVSLERELFENWSFSIRYIKKWARNLFAAVDAGQLDMDKLLSDGYLIWTNWEQVNFVDPYDGKQKYFWNQKAILPGDLYIVNPPGQKRKYDGLEVTLRKRYSEGWALTASYVLQHSRGLKGTDYWSANQWMWPDSLYRNPNVHINAVGRFMLDKRHQVKIFGFVEGPYGVHLSGVFRYLSGLRYTRTVSSTDLGIALSQGDTVIFAEQKGSRGLPALVILDLRIEKAFNLNRFRFSIFMDAFNILNGNSATSVVETSSSPTLNFEEMVMIQDPRLIRIGFRFEY